MTKDQIKVGQRISQVANPEYGSWTIRRHYHEGTWEVRSTRGEIAVCEEELIKFWKVES